MNEAMKHILVIDDSKMNLTMVKNSLSGYRVTPMLSGRQAMKFLEKKRPDLILLDVNMPDMDGKETLRAIRSREELKNIPVIFLTADNSSETEVECLSLGADDFIAKPFIPEVMRQRISRVLELWELRHDLESQLIQRTMQMEKVTLQSITAIAYAIDAKDPYTHGHSVRVAKCSMEIAKRLKWSQEDQQNLYYAALLHDIGKIGIPDSILNKNGPLTDEEMALMRKHPVTGGEILREIKSIHHMEDGARYHHERYDGTGYPYGLKGERIPLLARIIGVADAYDAMSSNRAYRRHLSRERVIEEIYKGRGRQFDPYLADLFLEMMEEGFDLTGETEAYQPEKQEVGLIIKNMMEDEQRKREEGYALDSLTGLHNKSYAREKIEGCIGGGSRRCALFILGVENLRKINDRLGYLYGDMMLKEVALLLKKEEGEDCFAARISGDEFLLFFSDDSTKEETLLKAKEITEQYRRYFQEISPGSGIGITMGIASAPTDGETFEQLYSNADKALYYARMQGEWGYHHFSAGKELEEQRDAGKPEITEGDGSFLKQMIEGWKPYLSGDVLPVDYRQFQKIYEVLHRNVELKKQSVPLALMTISDESPAHQSDPQIIEEAMEMLEKAVSLSIRNRDVFVKYSSCQMIVILVDSDLENARKAIRRIIGRFQEIYPTKRIVLSYHIQEMVSAETDRAPDYE